MPLNGVSQTSDGSLSLTPDFPKAGSQLHPRPRSPSGDHLGSRPPSSTNSVSQATVQSKAEESASKRMGLAAGRPHLLAELVNTQGQPLPGATPHTGRRLPMHPEDSSWATNGPHCPGKRSIRALPGAAGESRARTGGERPAHLQGYGAGCRGKGRCTELTQEGGQRVSWGGGSAPRLSGMEDRAHVTAAGDAVQPMRPHTSTSSPHGTWSLGPGAAHRCSGETAGQWACTPRNQARARERLQASQSPSTWQPGPGLQRPHPNPPTKGEDQARGQSHLTSCTKKFPGGFIRTPRRKTQNDGNIPPWGHPRGAVFCPAGEWPLHR